MEWLKTTLANWKVRVALVGGVLVVATSYGTCSFDPETVSNAETTTGTITETVEVSTNTDTTTGTVTTAATTEIASDTTTGTTTATTGE